MSETPAKHRRMGLILPWALFAALLIGWTIYWHALAWGARKELTAAAAQINKSGAILALSKVRARGFPLHLAIEMRAVFLDADRAFSAQAPNVVLHVNLSNPQQVAVTLPAPVALTRSDAPHRLSADRLRIGVRLRGRAVREVGIEGQNVLLDDVEDTGADLRAARFVANARPDPRGGDAWQVALSIAGGDVGAPARGLEPLGTAIEALDAAIVVEQAPALATAPGGRDPLLHWSGAGGALRVEALKLDWGPAHVEGAGRIAIDDTRRPQGALNVSLRDPQRVLAALAAGPNLRDRARIALGLSAAAIGGKDEAQVELGAARGWLKLNGAVLRRLAPIYGADPDKDAEPPDTP
jgi:hypothetical protein